MSRRLHVIVSLASCLTRSRQRMQHLLVECLIHEVGGKDLLNLIECCPVDAVSTILLALSDFRHQTVAQLVEVMQI
jgi:hypothetical protein